MATFLKAVFMSSIVGRLANKIHGKQCHGPLSRLSYGRWRALVRSNAWTIIPCVAFGQVDEEVAPDGFGAAAQTIGFQCLAGAIGDVGQVDHDAGRTGVLLQHCRQERPRPWRPGWTWHRQKLLRPPGAPRECASHLVDIQTYH
jgi:hypothetical protein